MKKKIKTIIDFFIAITFILSKLIPLKKKNKFFYINTEGGFGPSITRSHLLQITHNENWILLFGTKKRRSIDNPKEFKLRHNIKISKIFGNRLIFFPCGDLNLPIYKNSFEKIVIKILKYSLGINLKTVDELILNLEFDQSDNNFERTSKEKKNKILLLFEQGYFFKNTIKNNYYESNFYKKNFLNVFKTSELNFKGKINFFLRGKGKKYLNTRFMDNIRDSRNLEDYRPCIEYLIQNNWQVFLTGEIPTVPDWILKMDDSIIFYEKTNLSLNDYNLYVMSNVDHYIGTSSGPPLFGLINNTCKILLLETSHIGVTYLNSTVSYPRLLINNFSELEKTLILGPRDPIFLEELYKKKLVEKLSKEELKLIVKEYIENIENETYWLTAKKLGITNSNLNYFNSKISNYWLQLNNFNFLSK